MEVATWRCRHDVEKQQQSSAMPPTDVDSIPPSAKQSDRRAVSLGLVTHNNIGVVKQIHRACLPVSYGDRFYTAVINSRELCRFGKQRCAKAV